MARRFLPLAALVLVVVLVVEAAAPAPTTVDHARHPDHHAHNVVFSYLGDICIAREDRTNEPALTANVARETYPRSSTDGKWIAFSSNRHGNNDMFVVPVTGGLPERLTLHSRNE